MTPSIHSKSDASSTKSSASKFSISQLLAKKSAPDATQQKQLKAQQAQKLREERAIRAEATYAYLSMR
jgi:hypothetical protein